jgi:hypothetical protein
MLVVADELRSGVIELDGEQLVSVPLGHTDTDSTTCLHVSSIGLVACGDALYNDVHLHLGESNADGRKEWIAALDTIEALKPVTAIAGHKRPGAPDTPNNIEAGHFALFSEQERVIPVVRNFLEKREKKIPIATAEMGCHPGETR